MIETIYVKKSIRSEKCNECKYFQEFLDSTCGKYGQCIRNPYRYRFKNGNKMACIKYFEKIDG